MRKNDFLILCFLVPLLSVAQQFTNHTSLSGILYGEAIWVPTTSQPTALITVGYDTNYGNFGTGYHYDDNAFNQDIASIDAYGYATTDTLDVNADGLTDFLVSGYNSNDEEVVDLYTQQDDFTFTKTTLAMAGVTTGKLRAADLNQDGYDDFIVTGVSGYDYIAYLYINNGDATFTQTTSPFFGNSYGSITIFDANNDTYPDVLLCGYSNSYEPETHLYLNDGEATFTENTNAGITGLYFSDASANDYDNDGDLDLIASGMNSSYVPFTAIYHNDGSGNFTVDVTNEFTQLYFGTTDFLDVDGDGDADILLTGSDADVNTHATLYINENGTFTADANTPLESVYISSSHWADFDGDDDLDLVLTGLNADGDASTTVYANTQNDILYCTPSFNFPDSEAEPISLVQFNTIDNSTSATVDATTPQYEDFTAISTQVAIGETYTLTLAGNTNGDYTNYFTVYIDWNQDGTLSNSLSNNEKYQYIDEITNSTGEDGITTSVDITIPADAVLGNTRMRVIKNYQAPSPSPCDYAATFGQAEDYTITVTGATTVCNNTLPGESAGDTGCVTLTYNNETVSYTTVRTADNQIWLQQNLGSEQVATAATDASAYGDLFQWGRWDDGHQNRTSTESTTALSPNDPTGLDGGMNVFILSNPEWWAAGASSDTWEASTPWEATDTNGCDPCKALGEAWRLPTADEWQTVVTAEEITNVASAYNSNLKLTVAGARSTSGIYNDGVRGYYWSKTTSDNPAYAKYLYYSNYIVNTTAGGFREQGSSIRCIYDETSLATSPVSIDQTKIQLYPNPAKTSITISAPQIVTTVTVYDITGKTIVTQQGASKEMNIAIAHLAKGVYVVNVTTQNGSVTLRFIKS
ncbi:major paralogous domain-containing protein/Por secretion system C-terminal sorting domain-containing protein [Pustulibacterium marinum]|uniref:Major paralogous domain-containing protein/Por secretion system C-terminal sorting domain-containing protein n=1 Tax=Pustulibacterium marinum TaxID=1224947 RepID=A0A1I7I2R7_9FLAO|nr:FG-GAP-like repeat-containing protein [Pustulibacterium marinum]SFU67225.1 major paralogous domain-containing protein/Por secretion system C-terminal sorting domain-containing protein [Pustulibacterium marinum]